MTRSESMLTFLPRDGARASVAGSEGLRGGAGFNHRDVSAELAEPYSRTSTRSGTTGWLAADSPGRLSAKSLMALWRPRLPRRVSSRRDRPESEALACLLFD